MNQKFSTKKIVLTALLAALVVVGSALRITLPLDIAGTTSFHLGNIMCALSGLLLGPWWGGLAAGLGSAIYDMTNPLYISEAWITFLFKGAYGLMAGLVVFIGHKGQRTYVRDLLGTLAGAVTYAVLYLAKSFFYNGLLVAGLEVGPALATVVGKLPATIFNAVVALIFAPILSIAIRKALEKNHLSID
ncbi:MAG: ECF transporter S component [Candidatus Avoscillospira sp.]